MYVCVCACVLVCKHTIAINSQRNIRAMSQAWGLFQCHGSAVKLPGVFHNSWEMIAKSFLAAGIRFFVKQWMLALGFSAGNSFLGFPGPSNHIKPSGYGWGQP